MSDTQLLPIPPTAMLKVVHDQMRGLFSRYGALGLNESRAKKDLFHEIQDGLGIHLEIEEILLYPAIESLKADLAIGVVLKALQAHRQVKALLVELKALGSENQSLDGRMDELQRCVLSHLDVEEREIFPHARALPAETLRDLAFEMEKLRERLREVRRGPDRPPEDPNPFP